MGTELITSIDAPALSLVYKLTQISGQGRTKFSEGKSWYPGSKQIDRICDAEGLICEDRVVKFDSALQGEGLLQKVMTQGVVMPYPSLESIRDRCQSSRDRLPPRFRTLTPPPESYAVHVSEAIRRAAESTRPRVSL